ncbi:MAG: hypothetical protein VX259_08320 [Pseudomonadota bacterium]|nr:hypothetical protein [Pseudomonadota bacterium]
MERYPDIEIYLGDCDPERISRWLAETIDAAPLVSRGKFKWSTQGQRESSVIPVLLVAKAADGFASLWLDSADSPWATDAEFARAAAKALECEVRCSLGGWQPGDDPDRFLRVLPDGSESAFDWPDSGH